MSTTAFDTHAAARALEAAGMESAQAEAVTATLGSAALSALESAPGGGRRIALAAVAVALLIAAVV